MFGAKTAAEAIERALDFTVSEHGRDRLALAANDELAPSGIAVRDVYGVTTRVRDSKRTAKV